MQTLPKGTRAGSIPHTMRAAAIDRFGGPEVLTIHVLPVPVPDSDEVLIELDTAGVGPWDAEMRAGWWPDGKPTFPLVLGTDGSGIVVAAGARAKRFNVGDRVYSSSFANPKGGFYAGYVAVSADRVGHIPRGLEMEQAGAIPATGLTALQGVDDVLKLKKGETVLIHGASGAVGTLAVQFAKLRGARVVASASGADGMLLARNLGADEAVDGRAKDLAATVKRLSPKGVDAVLGLAGGEGLEHCIDALRHGGRCAYPNGVEPEPRKRHHVEMTAYDAVAGVHQFEELSRAVEAAKLTVVIAAAYRLAEAPKAHDRLAEGHVLGKIVLRIR